MHLTVSLCCPTYLFRHHCVYFIIVSTYFGDAGIHARWQPTLSTLFILVLSLADLVALIRLVS